MSWLVSMVVTFVLLPAAYRKEPEKIDVMLGWRPQVLHNGDLVGPGTVGVIFQDTFLQGREF